MNNYDMNDEEAEMKEDNWIEGFGVEEEFWLEGFEVEEEFWFEGFEVEEVG